MKAISLWQPWASLLTCGVKTYETQSWATKYRGPIAIHAGTKDPLKVIDNITWDCADAIKAVLRLDDIYKVSEIGLPLGCVIATAELVGCYEIKKNPEDDAIYIADKPNMFEHWLSLKDKEYLYGDWKPGRYAWEFANMTMLQKPIPAKGRQGLWNWEGDIDNG